MRFPPPKTIFVDVDGTLEIHGELNQPLIEWLKEKKEDGFSLVLWSMAGEKHAVIIADEYKVTHLFDHIISKPGYIIDDKGWQWIRTTINKSELFNI